MKASALLGILALAPCLSLALESGEAASAASAITKAPICSNFKEVLRSVSFPREALKAGIYQASFEVQFEITTAGEIENIRQIGESHPAFYEMALRAVKQLKCTGGGRRFTVRAPFAFVME